MLQLIASQAEELKGLKMRLVVAETEAMESKEELEQTVTTASAKLEKSQIDLVCKVTMAMIFISCLPPLQSLVLHSKALGHYYCCTLQVQPP